VVLTRVKVEVPLAISSRKNAKAMKRRTLTVPLKTREDTGYDRPDEVVTSGIPFPRGALCKEDALRLLDARRRTVPLQTRPLAWWPDGSVKWLLLTARVRLRGGKDNRFKLVKGGRKAAGRGPLRIRKHKAALLIETGAMKVLVDTVGGRFVTEVRVKDARGRWINLLQRGGLTLFVSKGDERGRRTKRYENGPADKRYRVTVEEEGPERVSVRVSGWHITPGGRKFCPYVVRIYAFRGSARLDIQHTLIYSGKPEKDFIHGFGMDIPLRLKKQGRRYRFGADRGPGVETAVQPTKEHPEWLYGRLLQMGASGYRMEKWTGPGVSKVKITEGDRSQGWAELSDGEIGCAAAVRNFWQEHPKGFDIDAEKGVLRVGLWPEAAGPLDLRRYDYRIYQGCYDSGNAGPVFPPDYGATGIAKTHEISLDFRAGKEAKDEAARSALFFNHPACLAASPKWYCATRAIGDILPRDTRRFPREEAAFDAFTDFVVRERDLSRWYGMLDYGDIQHSYDHERDSWCFDEGGYAWINSEGLPEQWLYLAFFRTGRLDYLEAAHAMTRHNRDVDMYHLGRWKGYGTRHNVNHWGDTDKEWRISMPLSKRWHFYLTGDGWTREVMEETTRVYQKHGVRRTALAPSMTSALSALLTKWELSGRDEDRAVVANMVDVFARAIAPEGHFVNVLEVDLRTGLGRPVAEGSPPEKQDFFLTAFGGIQLLTEAAELLDHAGLRRALVRHACQRLKGIGTRLPIRDYTAYMHMYAYAYRHCGDKRLLKWMKKGLRANMHLELVTRGRPGGVLEVPLHQAPRFTVDPCVIPKYPWGMRKTRPLPDRWHMMRMAIYANQVPFALKVLAEHA